MRSVNHYEVLGVAPDASVTDVRRRYLELARRYHPDFHEGQKRASAERQMQAINAAWAVLGDESSRRRYDEQLQVDDAATRAPTAGPLRRTPFRPLDDDAFHDHDERFDAIGVGDDLFDDSGASGSRPPRILTVLPGALFMVAVAALSAGLVTAFSPLTMLGLVALVGSGIAFVAAPVTALFLSRGSERE